MSYAFALAVKALFLLILFGAARLIAVVVMRFVPDGKLRRLLMYDDGKFP